MACCFNVGGEAATIEAGEFVGRDADGAADDALAAHNIAASAQGDPSSSPQEPPLLPDGQDADSPGHRGGHENAGSEGKADTWMTVPNLLSAARLAGVPVFLWLLLGPQWDLAALLLLVASGFTDWLDGKLARWLNQYSRIGELLDPAADRLYTIAILVAFVVRDIIPWWVAALLIGRDLVMGLALPLLRYYRFEPPEVHYLGKAATFCLMYAFPLLLLLQVDLAIPEVVVAVAYAFTIWGGALYVWSGLLYLFQVAFALRLGSRGAS